MTYQNLFKSPQLKRLPLVGACVLLAISAIYLLAPLFHRVRGFSDFAWVYMAGRTWLRGYSPYDYAQWSQGWSIILPSAGIGPHPPPGPFVYPPHWALIAVPLAMLPWGLVVRIWDLIDVLAYLGACGLIWKLAMRREPEPSKPLVWTFIALAGFNGAVRWCLAEAQMSLVPLLALIAAFWACHRNKQNWLACFAFFAALKPQISFLPLLFLLFRGGGVGLLRAGLAFVLVSLLAMAPAGLSNLPEHLRSTYQHHLSLTFNTAPEFFGVSVLLGRFSQGYLPLLAGPVLGAACVVTLAYISRRAGSDDPLSDPLWQVGILSALEVAFVPQHGYDLVMYTPVIVLSCLFRSRWLTVLVCLLALTASRAKMLESHLHTQMNLLAPVACLAIAGLCLFAARRFRMTEARAHEIIPDVPPSTARAPATAAKPAAPAPS